MLASVTVGGTVGTVDTPSLPHRDLIALLSRLHDALDDLSYRVRMQALAIASGDASLVGRATAEVEVAGAVVAAVEEERQAVVEMLTGHRASTLSAVTADAPEPWRGILEHEHRRLEATQRALGDQVAVGRRAARRASTRARESLADITGSETDAYSSFADAAPAPVLVDRTL